MAMHFEELDTVTRAHMLAEFEAEERGGNPYRGANLSAHGREVFPDILREAIRSRDEAWLILALSRASYWNDVEVYERGGKTFEREINVRQAAERLGTSELNTWYVRGLCRRLMTEGVTECQAYRGDAPRAEPGACRAHEGVIFRVEDIYAGHRVKYWPLGGDPSAISIPFQPGCHHTIRRVRRFQTPVRAA